MTLTSFYFVPTHFAIVKTSNCLGELDRKLIRLHFISFFFKMYGARRTVDSPSHGLNFLFAKNCSNKNCLWDNHWRSLRCRQFTGIQTIMFSVNSSGSQVHVAYPGFIVKCLCLHSRAQSPMEDSPSAYYELVGNSWSYTFINYFHDPIIQSQAALARLHQGESKL